MAANPAMVVGFRSQLAFGEADNPLWFDIFRVSLDAILISIKICIATFETGLQAALARGRNNRSRAAFVHCFYMLMRLMCVWFLKFGGTMSHRRNL